METDRSDRFPQRVPSGVPGLDAILRGGFLKAGIFIIQGSPGAGKTILANQICFHHAAAGGRALYVTLLAESHSRMLLHLGQLRFFDASLIPNRIFLSMNCRPRRRLLIARCFCLPARHRRQLLSNTPWLMAWCSF